MKRASGFGMAVVASLLLLAIGIVLWLLPFIKNFGDLIAGSGSASACKLSLYTGKSAQKCLEEVRISANKVELDGKTFMEKGDEGSQAMAKEALARLLVMCFSKGGGYSSRAFDVQNWVSEEAVCLRCFKFNIDEDAGIVKGLTDYLRDTKLKGAVPEKTYLESLAKNQDYLKAYMEFGSGLGLAPSQGTFEFKPNQDYDIFFIGLKKSYVPRNLERLWQVATGDFLKAIFATQDTYFAYIAESDKLQSACDRLVN